MHILHRFNIWENMFLSLLIPLEMNGVISSVIFNMDGTVEFCLGWGESYSFIEVRNLKIVGDVHLR